MEVLALITFSIIDRLGAAHSVTEGLLIYVNETVTFLIIYKCFLIFLFPAGWDNSVVVKLLKAEYIRRCQLRPLLWDSTIELPLENVFTRLKIVSRRKLAIQTKDDRAYVFTDILKAPFKGEDVSKTLADLLDEVEANVFDSFTVPDKVEDVVSSAEGGNADLLREHDEVNVFEIFKTLEKGEDVMAIVEGSPGIGKTTFCLKLASDWAHGKIPAECSFPKFEFVLLLKCRDIDRDIMGTIREQLLPRDIKKKIVKKLLHFMVNVHNQERILIILDGLDELPEKSRQHVDELLHRRILPFCYVLATSRQERAIEVRKNFVFDIHLEIKGYTESDAIVYVRRHFETIGQSPKGERLIDEMRQNTFLHSLQNNPLNLLLLCVIYEDYEGKLPISRTELYQVIVLCLLRRYCAKHNLKQPKDNNTFQKRFEEDVLTLGELAWKCLLNDRQSFPEGELAEREVKNQNLVAREIGLLYMEESLMRINPQHEYWFLHKTFQEYLAAAFIAHKLLRGELNVFEYTKFDDLVGKYPQVFLFVSGMLGKKTTLLFTQLGENLKMKEDWDWHNCSPQAATFFVESFSESGHAEQMATTLCSYIPFPQEVKVTLPYLEGKIFEVLKACRSFRNLQQPVKLTVCEEKGFPTFLILPDYVAENIQSCSQLQTLSIFSPVMTPRLANAFAKGLSENTTLSEFTLQLCDSIPCEAAVLIGELLATRKTLRKVTFHLDRVWDETWASAIDPALSADNLLKSVDLNIRGALSDAAVRGLGKLLSNKALASYSLNIFGDMQELVAAAVGRGIARQTALKSLDISVNGKLSLSCANVLQSSLLENRSLNDLVLTVRGEIPDKWQSVVENLRSVKKGSVNCNFYPDPGSSVTCNQVVHFRPAVVEKVLETKQHITVVIWGDLKCDGAEALFEVLVRAPLTSLTLKVHGKLSDAVANIIERYVSRQNTLSSLAIDIWYELAPGTRTLLQELSRNNETVQVKVRGVGVDPNEACNDLDVSIDSPASLTQVFSKVKNTRKEKINLRIIDDGEVTTDWPRLLGDALAENTSLTALDLTVSSHTTNSEIGKVLGDTLLRSSSLTVLGLTISNYSNMAEGWECTLINTLAKMASLTTLSLAIDDCARKERWCRGDLMAVKSLSTLFVVINNRSLTFFWDAFLKKSLEECTSLTKLCLTRNNYEEQHEPNARDSRYLPETWELVLAYYLEITPSLKELKVTINNMTCTNCAWRGTLLEGLSNNKSITSLTVTVNDYEHLNCKEWVGSLKRSLGRNKSLTTLTLIVSDYSGNCERHKGELYGLQPGYFPENKSLTELNLTVNIRSEVSEDWLPSLCDYLMMKCFSLRTVRLQVNNRCATSKSRIYDLSKLRLKYRSSSTFELSVTFYGE